MSGRAVVMVDVDGVVRAWNEAASALFGHAAADVLGGPVEVIVPEAFREAHRKGFAEVMAGAPSRIAGIPAHLPLRCADGSERTFPARLEVVRGPDDEPLGAVATFAEPAGAAPFTPVSGAWPRVRRIVANLPVPEPAGDAAFWTGLFGLETPMDQGWVVNHRCGTAQVQLISRDASAPEDSRVSVEVTSVETLEAVHAQALAAGYEIVHPLTDEPWGVRRFFVRTPQGIVVNVLAHP